MVNKNPNIFLSHLLFFNVNLGQVLAEDIVEYLLDPLLKGIYAGSVTSLSARSVLKKIFDVEQRYGSIIGGLLKTRKDKQKENPAHFLFNDLNLNDHSAILNKYAIYYLHDGMEVLIKTLVNHLQTLPNIELISGRSLKKLQLNENHFEVLTTSNQKYELDHLISAIPSYELANIFDDNKQYDILRLRLNQIPFVNMIVINLLYEKEDIFPKEAFGYLIPSRENSHLLGVLFDSCVRHQTDKRKRGSQLTVMMGGAWYNHFKLGQLNDEQIMNIVMNELKIQMNLNEKPLVYNISRMNRAIPVPLSEIVDVLEKFYFCFRIMVLGMKT